MNDAREDWQARVQARQAADLAKIPQSWRLSPEFLTDDENADVDVTTVPAKSGILTPAELEITELDAASIVKFVQNKSLRAVDVATAFCKRAAIAQQLTHCLTETFFDDAIERGKWLDNYLVENGRPVGPFHGLPVSIKDSFNYKGVQTTLGFVARLDDPVAEKNASLVDILLDLGAILYCKTNIPQSMMTADSHNHVFGRTLNPHRLRLTAGGSSGGEGALVAMKGAPIGVGTDVSVVQMVLGAAPHG
jgi:Asp-tRNA(Asn)/Glu-tRNA(Gln) amidotransferase A subunit family amidase